PTSAAVDAAGTVYVAWHHGHDAYISSSRDGARTWTPMRQLNQAPSNTAVFTVVAAGAPGHVAVAWYGTSVDAQSDNIRVMGRPGVAGGAQWNVFLDDSRDGGRTFTLSAVSGVVHLGMVCASGLACYSVPHAVMGRTLFDVFGLVIDPKSERAL